MPFLSLSTIVPIAAQTDLTEDTPDTQADSKLPETTTITDISDVKDAKEAINKDITLSGSDNLETLPVLSLSTPQTKQSHDTPTS